MTTDFFSKTGLDKPISWKSNCFS